MFLSTALQGVIPQRLSPAARFITQSQQLDINNVRGTEKHGIISKADVLLAVKAGIATRVERSSGGVEITAPLGTAAAPAALPDITYPSNDAGTFTDIPNSNMRKIIAKRLAESKATVPHMYTTVECDVTELMRLRKVGIDVVIDRRTVARQFLLYACQRL